MEKVIFEDLGLIAYQAAWDYQQQLHDSIKEHKLQKRRAGIQDFQQQHYLIFCEHPPVFTLGKSGSEDHLLLKEEEAKEQGFHFYKINRGGDITYHGPGQIVGYPILDLEFFFTDVHLYVRNLEEVIIRTLQDFGIETERITGYTGVWINEPGNQRKICAIGVHLSRWVTMHGFALNVNPDLKHFNNIIPCGITADNMKVTSMEKELGEPQDLNQVKERLKDHFAQIFNYEYTETIVKPFLISEKLS